MDRFSLEFLSTKSALWLALAPAFVALAVWVYYRTIAPLERPARTVLRILRALAFLIVLFALAEPVLTLILPQPGKPGLAVLIDGSASMALPGSDPALGSRADEAFALAQRVEEELSDDFRIDWFRFETGLIREQERPQPRAEGNTALGDVLEGIAARQGSRPVGGVMVLSDGANTVGADPVGAARTIGIPVYPVRVGTDAALGDAKITHVRTNPVAFSGEPTPLEIEIASSGFQGQTIEVQVRDQGKVLVSEPVKLGGAEEAEQSIRLDVRPVATGCRRFEIRLGGVDDAIPQNDLRSVAVEVLERKTRILVLEGRLDWDHTFLRRTLGTDSTFAYRFLLCDREGRWLPERSGMRSPDGPGELRDYAAIVLGEVPTAALGAGFYDRLARYIEQGGGLFVIGGRSGLARLRGTPIAPLLPVEISGGAWGERPLPVRLETAGITHPVTALEDRPARADRVWSALPPVWPSPDRLRTRPDGATLLSFEVPSGTEPALVIGYAGEGKVALLAAHDFWRWGFLPRGTVGAAPDVYGNLAMGLVRWLAEPTMRDRFLAEPVRGVFQNGETPEFRARLWDDRYVPVSDARVRLEITSADSAGLPGTRSIELRPQGLDGNYAGRTEPLQPGSYRYVAEARAADGQTLLGRRESIFWVDTNGSEFLRVRPDPGTLEQIARASGGEATDGAGLASILRRLPDVVQRVGRVREIELWNHLALFISFIAVLSVEWFLRRRRGLA